MGWHCDRTWKLHDHESEGKESDKHFNKLVCHKLRNDCEPRDLFISDSRFTSVYAFEYARRLDITAVGVIRKDRVCLPREGPDGLYCPEFNRWEKNASKGDFIQWKCTKSKLHLLAWKDSADHAILKLDNGLNPHKRMRIKRNDSEEAEDGTRTMRAGRPRKKQERKTFLVPPPAVVYDEKMGAVDALNRSRELLSMDRQTRRKHTRVHLAILEWYMLDGPAKIYAGRNEVECCHGLLFSDG